MIMTYPTKRPVSWMEESCRIKYTCRYMYDRLVRRKYTCRYMYDRLVRRKYTCRYMYDRLVRRKPL